MLSVSGPSEHMANRTVQSEHQQTGDVDDQNTHEDNQLQQKHDLELISSERKKLQNKPPQPPDPETCCESGCVNCVWIKYANEVNEYYPPEERPAKLKEILNNVEDYNVKMFLKLELGL